MINHKFSVTVYPALLPELMRIHGPFHFRACIRTGCRQSLLFAYIVNSWEKLINSFVS